MTGGTEILIAAIEATTGLARRRAGREWKVRCPVHADTDPSLNVREGDTGLPIATCRVCGAGMEQILEAVGLTWADVLGEDDAWTPKGPAVAAPYSYVDEAGALLFEVIRAAGKEFPCRRPDASKRTGWDWHMGERRVIYRLPKVLATAAAGGTIIVCEGEKGVEAAEQAGLVATCSPGGAGKWRAAYAQCFAGARRVVIVADRDEPGVAHARAVRDSLRGIVDDVTIMQAAVETAKADLVDHLEAGLGVDELVLMPGQWPLAPGEPSVGEAVRVNEAAAPGGPEHGAAVSFPGLSHAEALKTDVPKTAEIVEGVIEQGTLGAITALPETYKSLLATELAHKVAAGGEQLLLGRLPVLIQGAVGYWWQDDSTSNELRRLQGYAHRNGFTRDLPIQWHLNEGLRLPNDIPALREEIERLEQRLTLLDSLYNFLPGVKLKDEDVASILAEVKAEVCDRTGCTVVFLDHAPWPTESNRGQGRGYGSVFKAAAIRWSIFLERASGGDDRVWVKAQGNNIAGLKKSLAAFDAERLELRLIDTDHDAGVSADEYDQRVLDHLADHPWATTEELDEGGLGRVSEVRKARKRLLDAGRVQTAPSRELGHPGQANRWNVSSQAASSPVPLFPDPPGPPVPQSVTKSQPRPPRPAPVGGTGLAADPPPDLSGSGTTAPAAPNHAPANAEADEPLKQAEPTSKPGRDV